MKKILAILMTLCLLLLAACSDEATQTASSNSSEALQKQIYNDKIVTVYFIKKHETPGVQGMFSIDLKVENKSGKEITVYLKDANVNNNMVTLVSGIPLTVLSGKNGVNTFSGKCKTVGINSSKDIKKMGFKIWITDKSANTLETTKDITINF